MVFGQCVMNNYDEQCAPKASANTIQPIAIGPTIQPPAARPAWGPLVRI
jgi:hypothetical protein